MRQLCAAAVHALSSSDIVEGLLFLTLCSPLTDETSSTTKTNSSAIAEKPIEGPYYTVRHM